MLNSLVKTFARTRKIKYDHPLLATIASASHGLPSHVSPSWQRIINNLIGGYSQTAVATPLSGDNPSLAAIREVIDALQAKDLDRAGFACNAPSRLHLYGDFAIGAALVNHASSAETDNSESYILAAIEVFSMIEKAIGMRYKQV